MLKNQDHVIVGIHVKERVKHAKEVQRLLSAFGSNIRTRLGLHHIDRGVSSPNGLVLVEMIGPQKKISTFRDQLARIKGVDVQMMVFGHSDR